MAEPSTVIWDIGGVLLSNGFDAPDRRRAIERFALDPVRFEEAHEKAMDPFERGTLSLDGYLDRVLPPGTAPGPRAELRTFILGCSTPHPEVLAIARSVAASGRYRMAALNNESRELNDHRISTFGLADFLGAFFSSCYTGLRKPEPAAYRLALDVLRRSGPECLFIDDRLENLDAARGLGLRTVHYRAPDQLRADLGSAGVRV